MVDPSLDRARRDAGLTVTDLWLRYLALGGAHEPVDLEAFLHGALEPSTHERHLIAHAIGEGGVAGAPTAGGSG